MEKIRPERIKVQRKIVEIGNNRHGQHIKLDSTTIHTVEGASDDWETLATFQDTIKLTPRGKSIQVSITPAHLDLF